MFTLSGLRVRAALGFLPTSASPRYAFLLVAGLVFTLAGCGGGGTPPVTTPTAASPAFTPAGGTYAAAQTVSLTDATAGATIHYTLDGSTPTASSATYSAAITVSATETISAIAVATSYNNSAVASASYTILPPPAAAPTFSPAAGVYTSAQTVALADATAGASIYYTLDGSAPTTSSAKYAAPFTISATTTVNAIAAASGFSNSAVSAAVYTINLPPAAAPAFSPAAGTFTAPQTVTLTDATAGSTIYYTLDGSTPTANSARYAAPITISTTTTLNAIAVAPGYNNSPVASGAFTINLPPAATPAFSPAPGTYTSAQTVTLTDATAGAAIFYTLDGSTPTAASARYAAPLTVSATETIKALATATNYTSSTVAVGAYTINLPPAATPTFSPAAGTYTSAQTVSLADATAGAIIYFTVDGSIPTTASARYTTPLTVPSTETINAIATATGTNVQSAVGSATYTINLPPAATPTFSPAAGTYTSVQTVAIADATTGASIYYTLDGSIPTTASARYTTPLTVGSTETINAIATATGTNVQSAVGSATYTINLPPAATPTFSTAAGTFTSAQTISLADATTGAAIYYTLDGSIPTTSSARYASPISVSSTETISAIATASGYTQSAVASATYTINQPTAATPTFSPVAGTYTTYQTVSLADTTAGAVIYYTLDGSAPTTSSNRYTAAISITATETINAIATATGNNQSAVASAKFIINLQPAATPTFSPVAGTYTTYQTVSLTDTTAGSVIYYTLDGSTPTTGSARYSGAISVTATETINAIAAASGFTQSAVASATFTINLQPAATPTFSPAPATYTSIQTVSLADATAGSTIYYTLDGSTPTTTSMVYSAPLTVGATETIKAIANATGFTQSALATGAYIINLPTAATPTFSPAGGSYTSAQTVTLADATANAVIYYTLDGTTPTPSSNVYSTPITVSATETIIAIATATGYIQSAVGTAVYTIAANNPTVAVTLSTYNSTALLAPQTAVQFGTTPISATTDQLIIDEGQQFQTMEGFGAAFTDAAAYNLEEVELSSQLPGTLSDLFTRNGNGIGLSFMLSPMGASDESKSIFTYDDVPYGQTDPNLSGFTVAHDTSYIIPLIQAAKQLNPSLKYVASPWSPPAWMKNGQTIEGGTLNTAYYTAFTNYFIKYLQAYNSYGILPDYICLQNEPLNNASGTPSMGMDEPTQLVAIRDNVLPALVASGLSTKILLYDHNWDTPSYPASLLADPTLLASPVIAGTAWHGYGGPPGAQLGVQNQYPSKGGWETEHSGGTFIGNGSVTSQFISDFNEITLDLRSASKAYVKWNLALDQNRGPNIDQLGSQYAGCNTCEGIVTVNTTTGQPTKTIEYYTIGQYSKFILPGAVRVWSSDTPSVVSAAYINPDGTRALVAFNDSFASTTFQVQWGTKNFSYTLSAYAAATFVWSGTQTGTPVQSAIQQIQGDSFITATGLEVEETTDDTGSYDLGYVVDGATVFYHNVSFGAGVSSVNVRVANSGTGGTAEFHLDSPTGQLLGTVKIPNTGGYQVWQNVTTPVSTASGTHDLYMVLHGSGSIGNVNWFQFQ